MKRNRLLAVLLITVVVTAISSWWQKPDQSLSSDEPAPRNPSKLAGPAASASRKAGTPAISGISGAGSKQVQVIQPMSIADKTKIWSDQKTVAIDFWGKVLDQDDRPVAGAKVVIAIRDWRGLLATGEARFRKHALQTDALGLFAISGESGDSLSVEAIEKDGYSLFPDAKRSFSYNGPPPIYRPVAHEPFVFRLWKRGQPEPLIRRDVSARIPSDGTPVVFDLVTGKSSTNTDFPGDIVVRLQRDPKGLNQTRRFEWELAVQALDGGIQLATNGVLYQAPDSGYQPSVSIHVLPEDEPWRASKDFSAFLHHRQGRLYSRVNFRAYAHSPTGQNSFGFEAYINPAGSRNLEDDPRLRIEPRFESAVSPGPAFQAPRPTAPPVPSAYRTNQPFRMQTPLELQLRTNQFRPPPPPGR